MFRFVVRLTAAAVALSGLVFLGSLPSSAAPSDDRGAEIAKPAGVGEVEAELSGTVSTYDGGYLDADVTVYQWQADGEYFEYWDDAYLDTEDGADDYSFQVPTGSYYVSAESYQGDYTTPVYSGGATEVPVDLESDGVVEVTEEGVVADLQFQAGPVRQAVSGTITDTTGAPLQDIYVWAEGPWYADAYTAANGTFELALRPGSYVLHIDGDEDYEGASVEVEVEDQGLVLEPVALTAAGHQSVSGRVLDADGAPLAGADVALVRLYGDEGDWDDYEEVAWTETGADGRYAFERVRVDRSYTVRASASGYSSRYAGGVRRISAAGLDWVALDADASFGDLTLPLPVGATGRVLSTDGTPLANASVVGYQWYEDSWCDDEDDCDGYWDQFETTTAGEDGSYLLELPEEGATVTFRFARGGFTSQFLGGGNALPTAPDASNSRTVPASGAFALDDVELAPFVSKLGKVAGQKLDYCLANALPANDDESSDEVELPFDLKFYGNAFDSLYVNNNGNVTFGSPQYNYTPSALNGPTDRPIIAPFFADVDTRGADSNIVTYGASPDGKTFCVNWADVGYFGSHTDKLNTFQLLLTTNENSPGRVQGDFDIRFNYDELLWETGDASDGESGLGGVSAAAGFSAGTGESGSFVQLPGSLVNGALIDGGANALVGGSQNSTQAGRYIYEVRNNGFASSLGGLQGSVVTAGDAPVEDAWVSACTASWVCYYGTTNAEGDYSFSALNAGQYTISIDPPGDLFAGGATAAVTSGQTTTVPPIELRAPVPMPDNVQLTNNGTNNGVPSVYYGDPLEFQVTGCAAVSTPTYTITLANGQVIRNAVALTEGPAGVYKATIPPLTPHTGNATISTNIPATCGGAEVAFDLYIDPSGVVSDQWGRPIDGATVTLLHSETIDGDYEVVPDGSDIMSEDNRANPSTTGADGHFQWLVQPGFYKVRAEAEDCDPLTTGGMQIEPERTQLALKLECDVDAPAATIAPSVGGTAKVGTKITADAGVWPSPLAATVELLRNGTPLSGTQYVVRPGDVGATFTARVTARTPDAHSDEGPGGTDVVRIVRFDGVNAVSAPVRGQAAGTSATCSAAQSALATATTAATSAGKKAAKAAKKLTKAKKKLKKAKKTHKSAKIAKAKKKLKKAKKAKKAAKIARTQKQAALKKAIAQVSKRC